MGGRILALSLLFASLTFSFEIQLVGVKDDVVLNGNSLTASLKITALHEGNSVPLDSIQTQWSPEWAAKISQTNDEQLELENQFIGPLYLRFTYHQQSIEKKIDVAQIITKSNTPLSLQIDSSVYLTINQSQVTQTDTLYLEKTTVVPPTVSAPAIRYQLLSSVAAIDSMQISNQRKRTLQIFLQDSTGWSSESSLLPSQNMPLLFTGAFAIAHRSFNSTPQLNLTPQSFSPFYALRGEQPGTEIQLNYEGANAPFSLEMIIVNSDGILVRRFFHGNRNLVSGVTSTWWFDGLDQDGKALRNGRYQLIVKYQSDLIKGVVFKNFGVFK